MSKVLIDFLSPRKPSPAGSQYSCEQTDDQLVKLSLNRDLQRKPLKVRDFFAHLGDWSPLYALVIVLNGLCWMMGVKHDLVIHVGAQPKQMFQYKDCQGCVYTNFNNTTFISEQKYGSNQEYLGSESGMSLHFFGQISGAIVLAYFHRSSSRAIILVCGIFYTLFVALAYTRYLPLVKLVIIMCAAFCQMSRLSAMMHCMESVPQELRPFAHVLMESMGVLASLVHLILFHVIDDWFSAVALFAVIHFFVGLLYFILCPPSVLRSLATANRTNMDRILYDYAVNTRVTLDVDCLIDDILYKRTAPVCISKWDVIWNLLTSLDFILKYIYIILLYAVGMIMTAVSRQFAYRNTYMGFFETELVRQIFVVWANNLMAFLVYIIGRRNTILFGTWLLVTTHVLALQIDFNFFNVCLGREQPSSDHVFFAHFFHMFILISGKMIRSLAMLLLQEHVPVNCHGILVPLGVAFVELCIFGWFHLSNALENTTQIHENFPLVVSGMLGVIAMLLALFGIDDSILMPITTADIPCYYRPHEKFKEQESIRDDRKNQ